MRFAGPYLATFLVFVALDLLWLGAVAKRFYREQLSELIADNFNLRAAAAFYLMYPLGVVIFAVIPALGSTFDAALRGAMLGLFAYATYDLTNLATLRAWPLRLSLVDMLWGTVLTSVAATAGHLIARSL